MSADRKVRNGWLDPPEALEAFGVVVTDLISESDRGATMIAAEMVSNHLDVTFERLAPPFLKAKTKRILSYPGIGSTLSAKADIAALSGWIGENSYDAIGHLRRIRNEAAHSNKNFSLQDHADALHKMLNLGENVPTGIHNIAVEILMRNLFDRLRKSGEELIEQLGENPFGSIDKITEELRKRPDWSEPLEERLPRLKLGLGVCLNLSLMTFARDKIENDRVVKDSRKD